MKKPSEILTSLIIHNQKINEVKVGGIASNISLQGYYIAPALVDCLFIL